MRAAVVEAGRVTLELSEKGTGGMEPIGAVESLWRYPVKSMRGEALPEVFVGFPGVYGDRVYAFRNSAAPKGCPYLTSTKLEAMLLYQPRYRNPERMTKPPNLAEAEAIAPGLTPVYPGPADLAVDVDTPSGDRLPVGDPRLIHLLRAGIGEENELTLVRSDRALTDSRPVSLISIQTIRQLGEELGTSLDKRRFRANIYLNLKSGKGFDEDLLVGRNLRVGAKTTLAVTDRDLRCKMVTLDPDTGEQDAKIMKHLAGAHQNNAGVYSAVLVEGTIRAGDEISLMD
ncbi:MAG TPA: MOSC domain-containing protein [Terriglobia bacterium]|nr:MOSC domain-containing protein [Terriglobia bacterium]